MENQYNQNSGYQQPGYQQQGYQQTPPPSNHLAGAIVATVLCWPFGLPSILNAVKVNKLWYAGDQAGAIAAANAAHKWMKVSIILTIVFWALYFIYMICVFAFVGAVAGEEIIEGLL